jgi:hypothetical protein
VVDAAAASLWLDPATDDATGMLAAGFRRVFGGSKSLDLARAALACDSRAFVGYSRWAINDRWDVCASRRGLSGPESERAFFRRLARRSPPLPAPFQKSILFRSYLAERDLYVRATASLVLALRRRLAREGPASPRLASGIAMLRRHAAEFEAAVKAGRIAARRLWTLTRDGRHRGPNELLVERDAAQLRALRRWIARAAADPQRLSAASPVVGAWQLRFDVLLTRPVLQKIVVECQGQDGSWQLLYGRMTLEFRAEAARPVTSLRREFSVPVPGPDPRLRIAVRGIGSVGIANVDLTDGVSVLRPAGWRASTRRMLGKSAPKSGFPILDWERNTGAVALDFGKKKRRP